MEYIGGDTGGRYLTPGRYDDYDDYDGGGSRRKTSFRAEKDTDGWRMQYEKEVEGDSSMEALTRAGKALFGVMVFAAVVAAILYVIVPMASNSGGTRQCEICGEPCDVWIQLKSTTGYKDTITRLANIFGDRKVANGIHVYCPDCASSVEDSARLMREVKAKNAD